MNRLEKVQKMLDEVDGNPRKLFDIRYCGRCGGCGEYSFNLMHGTTCFKCHGRGKFLTARGKRQLAKFREMLSKPAGEIKVGDQVYSFESYRFVKDIKADGDRVRFLVGKTEDGGEVWDGYKKETMKQFRNGKDETYLMAVSEALKVK